MNPFDADVANASEPSPVAADDSAMAELRRVCGGDRVPPPPRYTPVVDPFGWQSRPNPIGEPSNDPFGMPPSSPDWRYILIVVLIAAMAGLAVRFGGHP